MTWHYRVLRHKDGCLALHEVYCDETGQPDGCTVEPVHIGAHPDEGLAGVIGSLEMALKDARERPVLDYAQFEKRKPQAEPDA